MATASRYNCKWTAVERDISGVVTKRIVAARPIRAGEKLTPDNVCVKRHDKGLRARYWDMVMGAVADRDYAVDEGVTLWMNS